VARLSIDNPICAVRLPAPTLNERLASTNLGGTNILGCTNMMKIVTVAAFAIAAHAQSPHGAAQVAPTWTERMAFTAPKIRS
jgi:hypothetical protein